MFVGHFSIHGVEGETGGVKWYKLKSATIKGKLWSLWRHGTRDASFEEKSLVGDNSNLRDQRSPRHGRGRLSSLYPYVILNG